MTPLKWRRYMWGWYADSAHAPIRYRVTRTEGSRFRLDMDADQPDPRIVADYTSARLAKISAAIYDTSLKPRKEEQ